MTLEAVQLSNDDRFSGDNVIQFLLYIPIGLILLCVRFVIGLFLWIASATLPEKAMRQVISTLACCTFGIYVKTEGKRDPKASLLVSNFVSALDPLAVHHAAGSVSLRKWKVPPFFASALGIKSFSRFLGKQHYAENPDVPVLVQPEGVPTNGKGLLLFKEWPFQICNKVQPTVISVERPFTAVTVHSTADSPDRFPWSDTLWYLWTPVTTYKVKLLSPLSRSENESDGDFIERIRQEIAKALQVEATQYTMKDLVSSLNARRVPETTHLAQRVKEVLPDVPMSDIIRDLARTHNVDVTITNFLEGVTSYTPETRQPDAQPGTSRDISRQPPPRYVEQPPTGVFPKNAKERQLSFQERKAQMIAIARQKYIEKHGLVVN